VSKFTKEIIIVWQEIPENMLTPDMKDNETMDFQVLKHVLGRLGFLRGTPMSQVLLGGGNLTSRSGNTTSRSIAAAAT